MKHVFFILTAVFLMRGVSAAQETNFIRNQGFEDADVRVAWTNFSTAAIGVSTNTFLGDYCSVASNRSSTSAGIAQDMRGLMTSGVTYWASAWVRVDQPANATSMVSMTMKEDYAGSAAKHTVIKTTTFVGNQWQRLAGVFRYNPTAAEEVMDLYISGPAAAYSLYVDDVYFLAPVYLPPTNSIGTDFIRAQGTNLVVGSPAQKISLRGVNVTAYSDYDPDPVEAQMWQARWDYERIAGTGMNVVRLNMWQKFWDDYTQPFTGYKQEAWEWLERQIVWAQDNNLYLLLDMHAPAGGYQGPNYSPQTRFWGTSGTAVSNRTRLLNFWVALADRYQHEPVIAGYDFINEPCPQNDAQWTSYATQLVDAVRAVDTNHLIVVETTINNAEPFVLGRPNIMYDFHSYEPWRFSYQLHNVSGYGDQGIWGETNMPAIGWDYTAGAVTNSGMAPAGSFGWTRFTSDFVTVTATNAIGLEPVLISVSSGGTVTFDDFTINEYDPSGAFVRECMIVNPQTAPGNIYLVDPEYPFPTYNSAWSKVGAGTFSTTTTDPHMGSVAFTISGVATASNNKLMFPVRKDYKYQVEAWIRGTNLTAAGSGIGFRHYTRPEWEMNTWARREHIENTHRGYGWDFWKSNNVPVNMGEFGISQMAIKLNRGGLVWMEDMVALAEKYNVNWNYYVYKSTIYGMYVSPWGAGGSPSSCNTGLVAYFTTRLSGEPPAPGAQIELQYSAITVTEGSSSQVLYRLTSAPTADVTVAAARISGDSGIIISSGGTSIFSTITWSNWQAITLHVLPDDDPDNSAATIQFNATGMSAVNLAVTGQDTTPGLSLSTNALAVPEGGSAQFSVRLTRSPSGTITALTARVSGDADIRVQDGASLFFDGGNWNDWQAVTIAASQDDDASSDSALFHVVIPGATGVVTATEMDDELQPRVWVDFHNGSGSPSFGWNLITNYATAEVKLTNAVNTNGAATGIRIEQLDAAVGASTYNSLVQGLYPNEAARDWFGMTTPVRFKISGLTHSTNYTFRIFCSEDLDSPRLTTLSAGSTSVTVEASYNTGTLAVLSGLTPTNGGELMLIVERGTNQNRGYINVLDIEWELPVTQNGDTDGDGLPNDWEEQYYGSSTGAVANAIASNGVNTLLECYIAGISPVDPSAAFMISDLRPLTSESILWWNAASGRVYTIYWTSNLLSGFQTLETNYTGGVFTDTVHGAGAQGFYKIDVELN